jgi:hypothetical protein
MCDQDRDKLNYGRRVKVGEVVVSSATGKEAKLEARKASRDIGDKRNKRSVGEQECQTEIGAPDRQRDVKRKQRKGIG